MFGKRSKAKKIKSVTERTANRAASGKDATAVRVGDKMIMTDKDTARLMRKEINNASIAKPKRDVATVSLDRMKRVIQGISDLPSQQLEVDWNQDEAVPVTVEELLQKYGKNADIRVVDVTREVKSLETVVLATPRLIRIGNDTAIQGSPGLIKQVFDYLQENPEAASDPDHLVRMFDQPRTFHLVKQAKKKSEDKHDELNIFTFEKPLQKTKIDDETKNVSETDQVFESKEVEYEDVVVPQLEVINVSISNETILSNLQLQNMSLRQKYYTLGLLLKENVSESLNERIVKKRKEIEEFTDVTYPLSISTVVFEDFTVRRPPLETKANIYNDTVTIAESERPKRKRPSATTIMESLNYYDEEGRRHRRTQGEEILSIKTVDLSEDVTREMRNYFTSVLDDLLEPIFNPSETSVPIVDMNEFSGNVKESLIWYAGREIKVKHEKLGIRDAVIVSDVSYDTYSSPLVLVKYVGSENIYRVLKSNVIMDRQESEAPIDFYPYSVGRNVTFIDEDGKSHYGHITRDLSNTDVEIAFDGDAPTVMIGEGEYVKDHSLTNQNGDLQTTSGGTKIKDRYDGYVLTVPKVDDKTTLLIDVPEMESRIEEIQTSPEFINLEFIPRRKYIMQRLDEMASKGEIQETYDVEGQWAAYHFNQAREEYKNIDITNLSETDSLDQAKLTEHAQKLAMKKFLLDTMVSIIEWKFNRDYPRSFALIPFEDYSGFYEVLSEYPKIRENAGHPITTFEIDLQRHFAKNITRLMEDTNMEVVAEMAAAGLIKTDRMFDSVITREIGLYIRDHIDDDFGDFLVNVNVLQPTREQYEAIEQEWNEITLNDWSMVNSQPIPSNLNVAGVSVEVPQDERVETVPFAVQLEQYIFENLLASTVYNYVFAVAGVAQYLSPGTDLVRTVGPYAKTFREKLFLKQVPVTFLYDEDDKEDKTELALPEFTLNDKIDLDAFHKFVAYSQTSMANSLMNGWMYIKTFKQMDKIWYPYPDKPTFNPKTNLVDVKQMCGKTQDTVFVKIGGKVKCIERALVEANPEKYMKENADTLVDVITPKMAELRI